MASLSNHLAANVPILTHSLQYATGVFEGIRAYKTKKGTAIFRLEDHMKRLLRSAKIYDMALGYTEKQLSDAALQLREEKTSWIHAT